MKRMVMVICLTLLAMGGLARGQDKPPGDKYVTREEYDKLQKQFLDMQAQMDALKKQGAGATVPAVPTPAPPRVPTPAVAPGQSETDQAIDELEKEVSLLRSAVREVHPGFRNVLMAGDAAVGYNAVKGSPSSFNAGLAP